MESTYFWVKTNGREFLVLETLLLAIPEFWRSHADKMKNVIF